MLACAIPLALGNQLTRSAAATWSKARSLFEGRDGAPPPYDSRSEAAPDLKWQEKGVRHKLLTLLSNFPCGPLSDQFEEVGFVEREGSLVGVE